MQWQTNHTAYKCLEKKFKPHQAHTTFFRDIIICNKSIKDEPQM